MSIRALAPLFVGDFESYRDVLVLPDDPREAFPARDLITTEGLARMLEQYRRFQPGDDRRALVSQWSRMYFVKLIVPTVAANLVLGHELPVGLDRLEVILGDEGLPEAFRIPHEGEPFATRPADPFDRFRELLEGNFEPLIEGWSLQVKLSRKVLWNNAANYVEWLVRAMAGLGLPADLLADGEHLIEWKRRPDGSRNPMSSPVRYVERAAGPSPLRQRRQCCIRYRLPDLALCENCPHIDRPPKGARLPVH
nr:siderophore-iron reductase FhuF [uncultured Marinobacter sp.]